MGTFFIYETNNKFEMYQYGLSGWIDIVKTANARLKMYSLGVAFLVVTILILIFLKSFPEWLKGTSLLFIAMGAASVISKLALSGNVLVIDNRLEPDKILASRKVYLLKNCGRLTDGINFSMSFIFNGKMAPELLLITEENFLENICLLLQTVHLKKIKIRHGL